MDINPLPLTMSGYEHSLGLSQFAQNLGGFSAEGALFPEPFSPWQVARCPLQSSLV